MSSNETAAGPAGGTAGTPEDLEAFRAAISYPPELPITDRRDDLIEAIASNQVVIVAGETGSGKSTQLPKLCLEAGRGTDGLIGHTQPRRLAARSIAERISTETGTEVGDFVGFSVRFNDRVGPRTAIRLMTDGILLNELQRDRRLSRYDTIIIDEAHERSLNIDFILGYLRQLLPRRPDLHIVVTSATIDVERFSEHFDDAPIIEVSGRTYPVEIRYRPYESADYRDGDVLPLSQPEAIAEAVKDLAREGPGDMLVFLPGERDIRETAEALSELNLSSTEIFPLYARLSSAEQHRVFRPHRGRRVVLATNVAETSVTVPGIRYVVDPGTARISRYNTRTKVQRLPIEDISQASANQRAGRCGRVGPGICVRLYSEEDFESRDEFTEPEILRTNLASVILQMAALGLGDIASFPFVEPPDDRGIADGVALLEELDALDPERHGTDDWLTPLGRELARLPVDPRFARMIIEAADNGALAEVLIIVAALSIQDPRERPTGREAEAAEAHSRFHHPTSDFVTLLKLWRHLRRQRDELSGNQFRRACRREFLNYNRVREWEDTRSQLEQTARDLGYRTSGNRATVEVIHRCLLSGLLSHIGLRLDDTGPKRRGGGDRRNRSSRAGAGGPVHYQGARGARFRLGRESVLADQPPPWIMAAELVETNRMWARMAAPIEPRWAEELGPYLVKHRYGDPVWVADDGVAYTTERVTLYGLPIVDDRRRTVGAVNPALGRELFIHHALVEGDWHAHHEFVAHNRELRAEMAELETRARRDLLVEQEALHGFFDGRLPQDITSAAHFDRWWNGQRRKTPDLLHLSPGDVLRSDGPAVDVEDFPNRWTADGLDLELAYVHDGDSPIDGLNVHVPVEVLNQLDSRAFEWTVPGLRGPLITHLIRSLPKAVRRELNPVTDTVGAVLPVLATEAGRRPLTAVLAEVLGPRAGTVIEPDDFDWARVPAHLVPTFRVIDENRKLLAEGKDLDGLRDLLSEHTREAIADISAEQSDLLRSGITRWDFGDLPTRTTTEGPLHTITAFPALVDRGDSVEIQLLPDADEQAEAMWLGTRRLLRLGLPKPVRTLDRLLDNSTKLAMTASPVQSRADWYTDTIDATLDHVIAEAGGPSWTAAGYERLEAAVAADFQDELLAVVDVVASLVDATSGLHRRLANLASADALAVSVADARAHVDRLVYAGFLSGIGSRRLPDVVRYLEAIDYRLDRLPDNRVADLTRAAECVAVESRHRELVERLGMTEELEELVWQLEELRVAQFAQHLRRVGPGAVKVSVRRIERALAAVDR